MTQAQERENINACLARRGISTWGIHSSIRRARIWEVQRKALKKKKMAEYSKQRYAEQMSRPVRKYVRKADKVQA